MKNFTKTLNSALLVLFLGVVSSNVHAQSGNALDFDGINDYVRIPYSAMVPNIASVQVSVKINGNTGQNQTVIASGGLIGGVVKGFAIVANPDNTWNVFIGNGGASLSLLQGPPITYGSWTTLTATYDGFFVRLYENGAVTDSLATTVVGNDSLDMTLGADIFVGIPEQFLAGQIDEVAMWNIPLTSAHIADISGKGLTGTEPNLQYYYKFNEGVAMGDNTSPAPGVDTLVDETSNKFTGTLNNFALNGPSSNWVASTLVLPITLTNFSGIQKDGSNLLQWSTKSEENSAYFEIQRSENGSDFSAVARVNAAGNSNLVKNYQYTDNELSTSSVYYYRLNMVDVDGSSKFSPIIFIRNSNSSVTTVYPNPARNQITINISDKNLINTQVLLSDLSGKVLQRISLTQASTQVDISRFGSGMYLLKFKDGKTIKIVKE
ncbi:MAG TPA: LamG-like jellyroll fold domain-containing protein [Hanamia sp.]